VGRSWREWKEGRALRAEEVEVGVEEEVERWFEEMWTAVEGVMWVEEQWAGREEGGGCWTGARRTGRSFACRARR
jgi:hypothetical protein